MSGCIFCPHGEGGSKCHHDKLGLNFPSTGSLALCASVPTENLDQSTKIFKKEVNLDFCKIICAKIQIYPLDPFLIFFFKFQVEIA